MERAAGCAQCLDQLAAAAKAEDGEAAYQALARVIDLSPEELVTIDTAVLSWVYNQRALHIGRDELYAELSRLFAAYGDRASREPESLWWNLADLAAERGNIDLARRAVGHLKNPHNLISVKVESLQSHQRVPT